MIASTFCNFMATDAIDANSSCQKVTDFNLPDVLPRTWANLAWDAVDLVEFNANNRIQLSQYQKLLIEATRENVNLRFLISGTKKYDTVKPDAKVSLVSSCDDEHNNLTAFVKDSRSGSMLVAITKTNLVPNFYKNLERIQKLTSFYLLDMERLACYIILE